MKIHAYTKSELARLYFPGVAGHVATNRLARWIGRNAELGEALRATGYTSCQRCLTVLQVRIIVEFLGKPD